jgi:hypothetical protein
VIQGGHETREAQVRPFATIQQEVLDLAKAMSYEGYSKHDALNARWIERIAGNSRLCRMLAIQLVMRCPVHIRPFLQVRTARNAKGLSLFARAYLSRFRLLGEKQSADEARTLLDWLVEHPSSEFPQPCWGYPYPWQDVGFFAPRDFPNRVVTSFVVQALLDGFETLGEERYLATARRAVEFLLFAPKTLYEDHDRRCLSYLPSELVNWVVVDVSALTGAAAARVAAIVGDSSLLTEAGRLIRYVASKQTAYGAWYYADPPAASHITHDNYHTGFILDALLEYGRHARTTEFENAYRRGLEFYRQHLFDPDGAPRFMHQQRYPFDVHGAAQGIITFARAGTTPDFGDCCAFSRRILRWTITQMYDPHTRWFDYQHHRYMRTRIRELRWCQAWMSWAVACHLEHCGNGM